MATNILDNYLSDKFRKPIAVLLQLAMCGLQYFLLTKVDVTGSLVSLILHAGLAFLPPTIMMLILRLTLGKATASFFTVPVWIISYISTFVVLGISFYTSAIAFDDMIGQISAPLVKLAAIYTVIGFIPTFILMQVPSAKEKEQESKLL